MEEKKDLFFNLLQQYKLGATARTITIDHKIYHITLVKVMKELIKDGKVKGVKFGNATLYKVVI